MPLFESQASRNDRLMKEALKTAYFKAEQAVSIPRELTVYAAWLSGGGMAADALVGVNETLAKAWGKGDKRKANALGEVCTLWMISPWLREVDSNTEFSAEERRRAREMWATNVLVFFGDDSPDSLSEFMNVDAQFNYDRDQGKVDGVSLDILFWRALRACDPSLRSEVPEANFGGSASFPLTTYGEQMSVGMVRLNPGERWGLVPVLAAGESETLRFLEVWAKQM